MWGRVVSGKISSKVFFQPRTQLMLWFNDLSGKMRHLTMKQAIRKPPVGHFSRHFHFKDGLSLVAENDREMLTLAEISAWLSYFLLPLRGP